MIVVTSVTTIIEIFLALFRVAKEICGFVDCEPDEDPDPVDNENQE